jgi:hypothetical protein
MFTVNLDVPKDVLNSQIVECKFRTKIIAEAILGRKTCPIK